jgi:hypothetical protein
VFIPDVVDVLFISSFALSCAVCGCFFYQLLVENAQ